MPRVFQALWLLLLLCSCADGGAAGTGGSFAAPNTVTLELGEYRELFRQAHLQEDRQSIESERKRLQDEYEEKCQALEKQRATLKEATERKSSERAGILSGNWLLVNHSAVGAFHMTQSSDSEYRGMAVFDFVLDLLVFDNVWTAIPLVDSQLILGNWKVLRKMNAGHVGAEYQEWDWTSMGPEMLLTRMPRASNQADEGDEVLGDHVLMTNRSGFHRIKFQVHSHVQNTRSLHSLGLSLAHPLSVATFRLHHHSPGPNLARITIREFSVEPAAYYDFREIDNYTEVILRFPSTKVINLKWRAAAEEKLAQTTKTARGATDDSASLTSGAAEPSAQATVQHDVLFSLAEGVLQSTSIFKFVFDAEQRASSVEIMVYGGARVTSVVAHGMQTWRAAPLANATHEHGGGDAGGNGTLVQVWFKSSVMSQEVIVQLSTESEFDLGRGRVDLPVMVCRNVVRQTGSIAVVKIASAEVYENTSQGVARAGIGEIPSFVRSRTDRPIVLAYKYLAPMHSVVLSVIHHEEVQTLSSVADSALYQVLVVDGQRMHRLTMLVQSSQQQYMVVKDIPAACTVWSLRVNSLSTKPVRNRDGLLMVPLLVGTGGDSNEIGAAPQTSVELAWVSEHQGLRDNGSLVLSPPRVDMPITALSVEVQFPAQYSVNFTGTLNNVTTFSHKQPRAVNYQTERHVVEEGFKFGAPPPPSEEKSSVKAAIPRQGQRYRFEKILVVGDNAALLADYSLNRASSANSFGGWANMFSAWKL